MHETGPATSLGFLAEAEASFPEIFEGLKTNIGYF